MANTALKTVLIFAFIALALTQQGSTTFPSADPSWN